MGRLIVAMVCSPLAACSLLVASDGLSGGGDGPDFTEAEAAVALDGPTEGQGDGTVSDAQDASSGCAPDAHALCDDFDQLPLASASQWTGSSVTGPAELTLATDTFLSSPKALSSVLHANASTAGRAQILRNFVGRWNGTRCAFDAFLDTKEKGGVEVFRLETTPSSGSAFFETGVSWQITQAGDDSILALYAQPKSGGTTAQNPSVGVAPARTWFHVVIDITWKAPSAVSMEVDGRNAFTQPFALDPNHDLVTFTLGLESDPAENWRVLFDNVVCDTK